MKGAYTASVALALHDIIKSNSLAFSYTSTFRTSFATSRHRSPSRKPFRKTHLQHRHLPIIAATRQPSRPGYYKNPSRAIEKGGGFYVPGLQGVRLRFFVPVVSAVVLALNHASTEASMDSLMRSEALAVTAAVAVFITAIFDTAKEVKSFPDELKQKTYISAGAAEEGRSGSPSATRSKAVQWATAVVTDLNPGIEIAHFRWNQLVYEVVFRTPNVEGADAGQAVERVGKERRPLYIARSSTLPKEVTLPFLGNGDWSVFMMPAKMDDVVVFASRSELSRENRRWLEAFSERIVE